MEGDGSSSPFMPHPPTPEVAPNATILTETVVALQERLRQMELAMQAFTASASTPPAPTPPAMASPHSVKPNKPENYTGRKGDVAGWLFEMGQYLELSRVPHEMRANLAASYLKGSAAVWWRTIETSPYPIRDWDRFCRELTSVFQPVNDEERARDRLAVVKQTGSVHEYVTKFRGIALRIPGMSEDEKVDRFIRGLKPHFQRELRIRGLKTLDEMIATAERMDAIHFLTQPSSSRKPFVRRSETKDDDAEPMELGAMKTRSSLKLSKEDREKLMKEGACFYCKEKGHRASACPKKRKGNKNGQ